jgi:type III pantothenate kinase
MLSVVASAFLTVDLGNSACKLVVWESDDGGRACPSLRIVLPADPDLPAAAAARLADGLDWTGGALASVADRSLTEALTRSLAAVVDAPFRAPPEHALIVTCDHPETIGLDRLFAARGALGAVGAPAIVVDAGTALTVDALLPDADGGGLFAGGAIAPGPRLLAEVLAAGAAHLPEVEPRPGGPALGRDTERALEAGCSVGFLGAARELVERIAREAGIADAPLVLAGGARGFLTGPAGLGRDGRRLVECEDLVHEGLLAAGSREVLGKAWEVA